MNKTLLVSTRNAHKVAEIREILGVGFEVLDLSAIAGVGEVEETGVTFEENATLKALAVSAHFDGWVIADDSGLEVDALRGAPGVWSARFSGDGATDASNRALLLEKLEGVRGKDRSARFRCVIVLARAGRKFAAFSGSVEGVAQLGSEVKNALSHRARALAGLLAWSGWND
jgi:XTP/dITP diphosphohydrolase